jgi:hypothetical protein
MSNAVVPLEQTPRLPTLTAGGPIRAIVPQDFEGAWRIASAVCKAGMAPRGLEAPEKAMVAILHGLEVGLTPMNALQSIAVVNGRPTVFGDGAIALARGSGLLEWMEEKFEGVEGRDDFKAVCLVKRKGEPKPVRGEFSVADAKRAQLWGKSGPWQQYAKRMLQMRARAFTLRDGFADVLKGLGIKEEVEDYHNTPARDEPPAPPAPPSPPAPPQIAAQPQPLPVETLVEQGHSDPTQVEWSEPPADQEDKPEASEDQDVWFFEEDDSRSGAVASTSPPASDESTRANAAPSQKGETDMGGAASPASRAAAGKVLPKLTGTLAERHRDNLIRQIGTLDTSSDLLIWARDGNAEIARLPDAFAEAVRAEFNSRSNTIKGWGADMEEGRWWNSSRYARGLHWCRRPRSTLSSWNGCPEASPAACTLRIPGRRRATGSTGHFAAWWPKASASVPALSTPSSNFIAGSSATSCSPKTPAPWSSSSRRRSLQWRKMNSPNSSPWRSRSRSSGICLASSERTCWRESRNWSGLCRRRGAA